MYRIRLIISAAAVAVAAFFFSFTFKPSKPLGALIERTPASPGRNNTVLFLTSEANGLSNVHVATAFALLQNHGTLEVHYASFPKLEKKVAHISDTARLKNPAANPIQFHGLPGPDITTVMVRDRGSYDGLIGFPGVKGLKALVEGMGMILKAWTPEEHLTLYQTIKALVDEIDPAVIISDAVFRPAQDVLNNVDRRHICISPNVLSDLIPTFQPRLESFWKYPSLSTGYPYPVPWKLIPSNIYMVARTIYGLFTTPGLADLREFLTQHGVHDPVNFKGLGLQGWKTVLGTTPEVNYPFSYIPSKIKFCGPILIETASAAEKDPELAQWVKLAPTMLINLGSLVTYSESRARAMIGALETLFKTSDVQVIWKFRNAGGYGDEVFEPVHTYMNQGRLRVESWLQVDPVALLNTGDIDVFVHHGGANCFTEAISTAVPQVVLPLWLDCYGIAAQAEYLGIGVWPGKDTAPDWDAKMLSDAFIEVLSPEGNAALKAKVKPMADATNAYGGRDCAAAEIAAWATYE